MKHCKPTTTLSKPHSQLLTTEGTPLSDPTHYRSLVGALQYLTFTGPNIAHSVNVVCQYMTNPSYSHLHLVKRVMRYLQGTLDYGLRYTPSSNFQLNAYSDSDWAADINTRRSITGMWSTWVQIRYRGSQRSSPQYLKVPQRPSTKPWHTVLQMCSGFDLFFKMFIKFLLSLLHYIVIIFQPWRYASIPCFIPRLNTWTLIIIFKMMISMFNIFPRMSRSRMCSLKVSTVQCSFNTTRIFILEYLMTNRIILQIHQFILQKSHNNSTTSTSHC
ncbi:hypothetical protein ACFX2H_028103 [Malus domestica]